MNIAGRVFEPLRGSPEDRIGKRLGEIRKESGFTQARIADYLQQTRSAITQIERRKSIRLSTLRFYLAAMGAELHVPHPQFDSDFTLVTSLRERHAQGFSHREVVFSIKPKYSQKIIEGKKTIELRRRFPMSIPIGTTVLIYETSPTCALSGIAKIGKIHRRPREEIWRVFGERACIARKDFDIYFEGVVHAFAIELRGSRPLPRPLDLIELRERFGFKPPQSFRYATPQMLERLSEMNACKFLIDTNVFIGLEDDAEVPSDFASLSQLAREHEVKIYIHEAARDDIRRDKDKRRRGVSLSKLEKFLVIEKMIGVNEKFLADKYGRISRPNDLIDATLLYELDRNVVDFLVTEDRGLHERAERHSSALGRRVLYVADAVSYLHATYEEPKAVVFPTVEDKTANTIPANDPIFISLRKDYPGFDRWWNENCVRDQRKCWVIMEKDQVVALVVRKIERQGDTEAILAGKKILKICTFKVRIESRGEKLGELLLKQVFWHAQHNKYDVVYLTTFKKQRLLIGLLEYYGFTHTHSKSNGELVYEKVISRGRLSPSPHESLFELARKQYPRFATGAEVDSYVIPIREGFHEVLFPELVKQLSLFGGVTMRPPPGNTIRKVYLTRSPAKIRQPGALIFFYKCKSDGAPSQAITTIGVFEDSKPARSLEELIRLAGGRSVYSIKDLRDMEPSKKEPVNVISFLLMAHLKRPMELSILLRDNVFAKQPPESIKKLSADQQSSILRQSDLEFEYE